MKNRSRESKKFHRNPFMLKISSHRRVLFLIPEIKYFPVCMAGDSTPLVVKEEGLTYESIFPINPFYDQGDDVHVVIPDYRKLIEENHDPGMNRIFEAIKRRVQVDRIHLAKDRSFFYIDPVSSRNELDNVKISLAFQREVINNIEPAVQPDLIHCHGWMTGLIPAVARQMGIPCLFTLNSLQNARATIAYIEDQGIDAAFFWQDLYYDRMPLDYRETRESNAVDFLLSGIFSASNVIAENLEILIEIERSLNDYPKTPMRQLIKNKCERGSIFCFKNRIALSHEFVGL